MHWRMMTHQAVRRVLRRGSTVTGSPQRSACDASGCGRAFAGGVTVFAAFFVFAFIVGVDGVGSIGAAFADFADLVIAGRAVVVGAIAVGRFDVAGAIADFLAGIFAGDAASDTAVFAGDLALTEPGISVAAGGAGFAVFAAFFVCIGLAGAIAAVLGGVGTFACAGTRLAGDFVSVVGDGVAVFAADVAVLLAGTFAVAVFAACAEFAPRAVRVGGADCVVGNGPTALTGVVAAFGVRGFGPTAVAGVVAIVAVFAGVFVLRGDVDSVDPAVTEGAAALAGRSCSRAGVFVRLPFLPEILPRSLAGCGPSVETAPEGVARREVRPVAGAWLPIGSRLRGLGLGSWGAGCWVVILPESLPEVLPETLPGWALVSLRWWRTVGMLGCGSSLSSSRKMEARLSGSPSATPMKK